MKAIAAGLRDDRYRGRSVMLRFGIVGLNLELLNRIYGRRSRQVRAIGIGGAAVSDVVEIHAVDGEEVASPVQRAGKLWVRRRIRRIPGRDKDQPVECAA